MKREPYRLRQWMEETHSTAFELRRHFFLRFFDSDLVSTPGQWRVVVAGAIAVLLSLSLIWIPAYYHKYLALNELDSAEPLRRALLADVLFLIALAMCIIGLFTTLLWTSLFPALRDYLALAGLPIRPRDIFAAKFAALLSLAAAFVIAVTLPTSVFLPMIAAGRNAPGIAPQIPGIFVSSSLAALFVFFSLVALQGVLLNVLPANLFARVSLLIQGALLMALLCSLPFVFSIADLQQAMTQRPEWLVWAPPAWFLGLDQVIAGNREPLAVQLAWLCLAGIVGSAAAAVLTYTWSYRRHRIRVLESAAAAPKARRNRLAETWQKMLFIARERTAPTRLATETDAILNAAFEGRVNQLYVSDTAGAIGVFERDSYRSHGKEDLLNLAMARTILDGGEAYTLPADMMPDKLDAIAILRF